MFGAVQNLLLADLREVIVALGGLVWLLIWVIKQIADGKKAMGRPAGQRPAAPPGPAQAPVAVQPGAKPQAVGGLRGEVEDFLRRASGQQPGGQAGPANRPATAPRKPQPASADKIEVLIDEQGRMIERRRPAERTGPVEPRPSAPRQPAARPASQQRRPVAAPREPLTKRKSVGEHVRQHIDSGARAVGQQASQLGQRIVRDDAEFDVQLKAKFDRDVGTLASKERVTDTPSQSPVNTDTTSPAALLAALLSSPVGMQQAIVMNEILRRPSERW